MMHNIESHFWIGDTVYRVVDDGNSRGQVLAVEIGPHSTIRYRVAFIDGEATYMEMELSESPCWIHTDDAGKESDA